MDTQTQALVEHNRPPSVQGKEQENCAVRLEIVIFFPGGNALLDRNVALQRQIISPKSAVLGFGAGEFLIATPQLTIAC